LREGLPEGGRVLLILERGNATSIDTPWVVRIATIGVGCDNLIMARNMSSPHRSIAQWRIALTARGPIPRTQSLSHHSQFAFHSQPCCTSPGLPSISYRNWLFNLIPRISFQLSWRFFKNKLQRRKTIDSTQHCLEEEEPSKP
jgi:hypothetical protein